MNYLSPTQITPNNQIRATYNDETIRVYQAYPNTIADSALTYGTFVSPPFKKERMTWIKPSFLWMMYRSGWGLKEEGQARILAIDITREGFEWALEHSCPSHPPESMDMKDWKQLKTQMPVRIQWDPERNLFLEPLEFRTIQIGLSKQAVEFYLQAWIQKITDITDLVRLIHAATHTDIQAARRLLPLERPYLPLSEQPKTSL